MCVSDTSFCGLYCAECPNHTGIIADSARDLRKELRKFRFDKTAELLSEMSFFKEFKKYSDCYEVLGAMVKMRCNKMCRNGGGNPFCKIRKCCEKKGFTGCWECDDFESCDKLKFLEQNHGKAHIKNMKKIKKNGLEEFSKGKKLWYIKS
jgi:ribosomal protein S8